MSQKGSDDEKDKSMEIDFDAFERQIDLEIDKLFVPVSGTPLQAEKLEETGREEEIQETIEKEPLAFDIPEVGSVEEPLSAFMETANSEAGVSAEEIGLTPAAEPVALEIEEELQVEPEGHEGPAELDIAFHVSPEPFGALVEPPSAAQTAEPPAFDELEIEPISFSEPESLVSPMAESSEAQAPTSDPFSTPLGAFGKTEQVSAQMESYEQMLAQSHQPDDDMDEMDRLIEALDIAYLSLDWDFSAENIAALETAVMNLGPYWKRIHEATSIVKVMRAVLQHLKTRPDSVSPPLVDFLSDSLEFLKSLVQSDMGPGPRERAHLKSLMDRLQSIRGGRSPASGESKLQRDLAASSPESESSEPASPAVPSAPLQAERLNGIFGRSLRELAEWMVTFRERSSEALQRLDEESKRLLQLEQTLGKKPALAPVTSRLTRARTTMVEYIAAFRQNEHEWLSREESVRRLERSIANVSSASAAPLTAVAPPASSPPSAPFPVQQTVPEAGPIQTPPQPSAPPLTFARSIAEAIESRQERVCLFEISGIRFALPASNVVKIQKLPDKKARKLISRGYATLEDFKPLFKNLKTGLLGTFSDLPTKDLKSYRFLTLPHEMIRPVLMSSGWTPSATEAPPLVGGVILVSNMQYHGMIFTDPSGAEILSETVEMRSQDGTTLGIIQSGSLSSVKVLNIDLILNKLHE